ncbi:TonB-dependent receptor [Acidicapsa dinghuensis]|uniref:TonB-dependent receptor n=1 Tax=Acidicapsa dinghuensis TaxID=2218256 RepID=A0ABW1EJR2_9BACT|nr:TonB-dependent receptor [Acidicapsa dinghuensis]
MTPTKKNFQWRTYVLRARCLFHPYLSAALVLLLSPALLLAGVIRGTVTDNTGATVTGATIVLLNGGKYVAKTLSTSDGSYQFVTGQSGRFTIVITAPSFRQLDVPAFWAGSGDSVEKNLVMEPQWVHQSIVVTATGTPTPQQQTTSSVDVLSGLDLQRRYDFVSLLRLQPGTSVVQAGELGAQTSLFIRGGDSNAARILMDGATIDEVGGIFDFGSQPTTGIENTEVLRGPDSSLYGADAASGVVSFNTPRGYTPSPLLTFHGDIGNFTTFLNELELAGSHKKLDYYGAYSWLQTQNTIPMDEYHLGSGAVNLGWAPTANLIFRGTAHYNVSATGVPNAWDFYHVADDRKQSDQNLYMSGSVDYQFTPDFHNHIAYGGARKREQSMQWYPAGICVPAGTCEEDLGTPGAGNYYGLPVTIAGANGYSTSGQAILNYSTANYSVYPNRLDLVNNRDQALYQGDFHLTPHLMILGGFHFEDERGAEREPVYFLDENARRHNYDYLAEVHGDFLHSRIFYTLGGSLEHYQVFGTQTSPRGGISVYAFKPSPHVFSGTRVTFNFAEAVREPTIADESGSLYGLLLAYGEQSIIQQLNIPQLSAPTARTYEGGVEQGFLGDRVIFHVNFFHNEFGRQIEDVGTGLIPYFFPDLATAQQQQLEGLLNNNGAFSLDVNSQNFRALGIETTAEAGLGRSIFLRGGYTYLDAVVQHSFSSDEENLLGGYPATFDGIPLGIYSPLVGARPFRRPPHTGFVTATYAGKRWTLAATGSFASRSDDSTYLGYMDINQGNSLLLPNRNLDYGFAKIDAGASFQLVRYLSIYGQTENLTSDQHIAPIGYPSLPFTFRVGLRIQLGKQAGE